MRLLEKIEAYSWFFGALATIVAAFLTANLVSIKIGSELMTTPTLPVVAEADENLTAFVPLNEYEIIVQRSLFDPSQVDMNGGFAQKRRLPEPMERFVLLGTISGLPQNSYAIIQRVATGKIGVYKIGDNIAKDVAEVVDISRKSVELRCDDGLREIKLAGSMPLFALQSGDMEQVAKGIKKINENERLIDRGVIDGVLANPITMMRGMRIKPVINRGQIRGFKIYRIRSNSLFHKLGMKNKDILHRINGTVLQNPESILDVLINLRNSKWITIDLTRDGKRQTLEYRIQ